jgi:C-terminal processing protease CtpA/Prc
LIEVTVQSVWNLSDDCGLKLTTRLYYLTDGQPVSHGITPDVAIAEKEGEDYPLTVVRNVLQKASKRGYPVNYE